MGLVDKIFGSADDYVTIGFVIFLVIAGMYFAGFDVTSAMRNFSNITKYLVGFAAAAAGVYVLYKSERSSTMADDVMGAVIGFALIGFGGAIAFGGTVTQYLSQAASAVKSIIPLAVGGAVALVGTKLTQSKDKMTEILGILMIIIGLALLGFKLTGLW